MPVLFFTVAVAFVLGLALVLLMKRTAPPLTPEESFSRNGDGDGLSELTIDDFRDVCRALISSIGLQIVDCQTVSDGELEVVARDDTPITGGQFLIHCLLRGTGELVDAPRVIALSDSVKAEKASKGILMTTGYFSQDALYYYEGAPLELINRQQFLKLLEEHKIPLPGEKLPH